MDGERRSGRRNDVIMNSNRPPNVVYILADDMGYGDVSSLNPGSRLRTDQIDRLAAGGMKFTDAHARSAVCTPSRYSILTGRYCWRSTLKSGVGWGYTPHLIEDDRMTVASFLGSAGYRTGCVGKWHLGLDWVKSDGTYPAKEGKVDFTRPIENGPRSFGFDYFFGIPASLDMSPYVYIENDRVTRLPDRVTKNDDKKRFWREGPTGADFFHIDVLPTLTRKARDFVAASSGGERPFFLYFPLPGPHTPILPTADFVGKSGANEYGDFVLQCDSVVGALMEEVDKCGQTDNTIFIFTSDNGCSPNVGLDELALLGHHPSYIFRGHKADIYDGGHRIPLIVKWPEVVPRASACDRIVCLSDLFATLSEVLDIETPDNVAEDSVSNLPLLRNGASPQVRDAIVHHSIDGSFSIRRGQWKLELCPGSGGWSWPRPGHELPEMPPMQLYDMDGDVGERVNLYDQHPGIVEELTNLLARYVQSGRSTPGAPQKNTGPASWPQLNWLEKRSTP